MKPVSHIESIGPDETINTLRLAETALSINPPLRTGHIMRRLTHDHALKAIRELLQKKDVPK